LFALLLFAVFILVGAFDVDMMQFFNLKILLAMNAPLISALREARRGAKLLQN
jgi:hypothetical protein